MACGDSWVLQIFGCLDVDWVSVGIGDVARVEMPKKNHRKKRPRDSSRRPSESGPQGEFQQ